MLKKDIAVKKQIKILVAEDSPTQAEELKYILERSDFKVSVVTNGKEAIEFLKSSKPDVVITDVLMPEMSGYELCKHIRSNADLKDTPIIVVTALSDPTDVIEGLEAEADNYITKPYDEKFLISRIQYLMANKELRKGSNAETGIDVFFSGKNYYITAERTHMLDLLLSTYESAYNRNCELVDARNELKVLNKRLELTLLERTAEIAERRSMSKELKKSRDELELRVLERTAELSISNEELKSQIEERKRAEAELELYKRHLEDLVKLRTFELTAANKELEAFSYSVSHDLRAPLRHMSGFVELIEKRLAGHSDPKISSYAVAVARASKKMGMLIDDLLAFSRMGREEMKRTKVNIGTLVSGIIREVRHEAKGRDIKWEIGELPEVYGDRAMLRLAFVNLISNAVKYTGTRLQAEIEIGCKESDREFTFFVKDNGVGFDMKYAGKLFGVFQRLHSEEEFEGTGIGLANVRRIISRHGGSTWAEGSVGEGATFYFTLPKTQEL